MIETFYFTEIEMADCRKNPDGSCGCPKETNKFEPQCKTQADCHREWARILDMCAGTKVNPFNCWKQRGQKRDRYPRFDGEPHSYEFAIAIVEDKPVFRGDTIYSKIGLFQGKPLVIHTSCINKANIEDLSWNPPEPKQNQHKYQVGEKLICDCKTALNLGLINKILVEVIGYWNELYRVKPTGFGGAFLVEERHLSKPAKPKMSIADVPAPYTIQHGFNLTGRGSLVLTFNSADDCNAFYQSILEGMKNAS